MTICLWLSGQLIFVQFEFGLVYLLFSLFFFMFLNLGVRKEGEVHLIKFLQKILMFDNNKKI